MDLILENILISPTSNNTLSIYKDRRKTRRLLLDLLRRVGVSSAPYKGTFTAEDIDALAEAFKAAYPIRCSASNTILQPYDQKIFDSLHVKY